MFARRATLLALLLIASRSPAQCWGPSLGGRSAAPVFSVPAPVIAPTPAPAPPSPDEMEAAVARVLARREAKAKAAAKACVGSCGCDQCGERCPCRETASRCGAGCACVVDATGPLPPTGVVRAKLSGEPRYLLDGQDVTRDKAMRAIAATGDGVPDDAGRLRLVVAGGTEAERRAVLDDVAKLPAALAEKVLAHAYPADSPLVRDRGYVATGAPSITLLTGAGKVLGRNLDGTYRGAAALAAAVEAGAKYDPAKDKDLYPPADPLRALWDQAGKLPPAVFLLGGAGAALALSALLKKKAS